MQDVGYVGTEVARHLVGLAGAAHHADVQHDAQQGAAGRSDLLGQHQRRLYIGQHGVQPEGIALDATRFDGPVCVCFQQFQVALRQGVSGQFDQARPRFVQAFPFGLGIEILLIHLI